MSAKKIKILVKLGDSILLMTNKMEIKSFVNCYFLWFYRKKYSVLKFVCK